MCLRNDLQFHLRLMCDAVRAQKFTVTTNSANRVLHTHTHIRRERTKRNKIKCDVQIRVKRWMLLQREYTEKLNLNVINKIHVSDEVGRSIAYPLLCLWYSCILHQITLIVADEFGANGNTKNEMRRALTVDMITFPHICTYAVCTHKYGFMSLRMRIIRRACRMSISRMHFSIWCFRAERIRISS